MGHRANRIALLWLSAALLMPPSLALAIEPDELADALRFRREFGFNDDPAHIAAISADPQSSRAYGVALSDSETVEMDRRRDIESRLEELNLYLATQPDFGGAYIDQAAGHVIVIGFTDPAEHRDDTIRGLLPTDARFQVRAVAHSAASLRHLQSKIHADEAWIEQLGTLVIEVPINFKSNRVEIGLRELSDSIRRDLEGRYGADWITLYETSNTLSHCVDRNHCHGPLRAGLQLYDVGCSTNATVSGGSYYLLTAGHCFVAGHTYQHPNGTNLGTMVRESFHHNTSFDGGIIPIPSAEKHSRIWNTNASWFSIYFSQPTWQEMQGQSVCLSGRHRANGLSCGTVFSIGFPFKACHNPDCTVYTQMLNQRSGTYPNAIGDSGGAVFRAQTGTQYSLMGVHAARNLAGRGIYSHISYLHSHLDVFLCRNPSCP